MEFRIIFRSEARDEAVEAAAYIRDRGSPEAAAQWYTAFEEAVASLAEMPRRCPYARENDQFPDAELRQLLLKSHRIIFTIRGDQVHILHVRHARRDVLDGPASEEQSQETR